MRNTHETRAGLASVADPPPIFSFEMPLPPAPPATGDPQSGGRSDKARRRQKAKQREKLKKELLQQSCSQGAYVVNPALINRHLKPGTKAHGTKFAPADMPHTSTGYQGRRDKGVVQKVYTLGELLAMGFELKAWDGRYVRPLACACSHRANGCTRTPTPLLDPLGNVFGVCSRQPKDASWASVSEDAAAAIEKAGGECEFPDGSTDHRRGRFPAMAVGVSYGGGQQVRWHGYPSAQVTSFTRVSMPQRWARSSRTIQCVGLLALGLVSPN